MNLKRIRSQPDLDLKIALAALNRIRNIGGVICEDCGHTGITHPECRSSYSAWQTASTALRKIRDYQRGDYDESV